MRSTIRTVGVAAVTAALLAAGLAVAERDGSGDRSGDRARDARAGGPPRPMLARNLTYGELHVRRNGQDVVVRLDRGRIKAVDSNSITLTRNDGDDVTIPLDGDTRFGPPRANRDAGDLRVGQTVTVVNESGGAAEAVLRRPRLRHRMAGPPPPPPAE